MTFIQLILPALVALMLYRLYQIYVYLYLPANKISKTSFYIVLLASFDKSCFKSIWLDGTMFKLTEMLSATELDQSILDDLIKAGSNLDNIIELAVFNLQNTGSYTKQQVVDELIVGYMERYLIRGDVNKVVTDEAQLTNPPLGRLFPTLHIEDTLDKFDEWVAIQSAKKQSEYLWPLTVFVRLNRYKVELLK